MLRTHKLNDLNESLVGKEVKLCGWVDTIRIHGNVSFLDLRDRYGKVQCVISKKGSKDFLKVKDLNTESCISITGEVKSRPEGSENKNLESGKFEISIKELEVYNKSPIVPFQINDESVTEETRLKHRFLDLRSDKMQSNMKIRSDVYFNVLNFFKEEGFIHIETPILGKSTPEGARDFIVPSRKHSGKFYALPQSPQLFKQLSQISGFDKYIQIARCFRDEDSRKDRQPEFTQIDLEMSFVEQEDVVVIIEKMIADIFKKIKGIDLQLPFKRISYSESMKKYGRDNPDLRKNGEEFAFCWVVDFPSFEYSEEEKRYKSTHHPFTMPVVDKNGEFNEKSLSRAYDLVLNGVEIGGGSIRIHDPEMQKKVFKILNISEKEFEEKFGFLLSALSYGAPPHGGFAFGLDRLIQLIVGEENIREVLAFPKNSEAVDLMLDAPACVGTDQLKDVSIELKIKKKEKIKNK